MAWFNYRQNNSGGVFVGPAISLCIEAETGNDADSIAERYGAYFDGDGDCPCCGDRWYASGGWDKGESEPYYSETDGFLSRLYPKDIPQALIIHADGREEIL